MVGVLEQERYRSAPRNSSSTEGAMTAPDAPTYSFVIPVYNEQESLPEMFRKLAALMELLDGPAEAVVVDDGSSDGSFPMMAAQARADPRFKVLRFSRNFGHQIAVTAGLDHAGGQAVIILDADLQDPPEAVLEMAARWREGYEVVYGVRRAREGEGWFKRSSAAVFYRVLARLSSVDIPRDTGDFRLADRKAVEAIRRMPEKGRFLRGMFAWIGFRQKAVYFSRAPRRMGKSKYPLGKMLRLAADGALGFSGAPLRFALYAGGVVAGLSFACGAGALILKAAGVDLVTGWASLALMVSFLGAVQLMVIGIAGEYLARILEEVRRRPLYIVRESEGFGQSAAGSPAEGPEKGEARPGPAESP